MAVWALGDLHLSFGIPNKKMDVFGKKWIDHAEKISDHWLKMIHSSDLVLLPGDISWAMRLEDVVADLNWIDKLPGTKVMIRGNHDYWWSSLSKMSTVLPPSIHLIQNDAFLWNGIGIAGARMWDSSEYRFDPFIEFVEPLQPVKVKEQHRDPREDERIFERDLQRLEMSLRLLSPSAKIRIAMTHYPPISADLQPSRISKLLTKYGISICVFGHLHNVREGMLPFGEKEGVLYLLTSCDYLNFQPLKILD